MQKFKVDNLKIGQFFIRNIANNPENAVITKAMIQMAHGLNLKVIAEGVEMGSKARIYSMTACRFF